MLLVRYIVRSNAAQQERESRVRRIFELAEHATANGRQDLSPQTSFLRAAYFRDISFLLDRRVTTVTFIEMRISRISCEQIVFYHLLV